MTKVASDKLPSRNGFTLVELILYLAIVSTILVSVSYLMLDILSGQTNKDALTEVNENIRFISFHLTKDIRAANDIVSLTSDELVLRLPPDVVTYRFDSIGKKITRQVSALPAVDISSGAVEVSGSFTNLSYLSRSKNVGVAFLVSYKNPGSQPQYNASSTANFAVELRGRR